MRSARGRATQGDFGFRISHFGLKGHHVNGPGCSSRDRKVAGTLERRTTAAAPPDFLNSTSPPAV